MRTKEVKGGAETLRIRGVGKAAEKRIAQQIENFWNGLPEWAKKTLLYSIKKNSRSPIASFG